MQRKHIPYLQSKALSACHTPGMRILSPRQEVARIQKMWPHCIDRYTLGYHCVPMREEEDRGHGVPSLHHRQPLPAWSRASDLAISHWASNSCELTLSKEPASNRLLLPLGRRLLLWSKGTQSQQHSFHISSLHPFQVCTTKQTTKPSSSPTLSPFLPNSPQIPPY